MSYTTELDQKWENENGKTSHMKVLMVHDAAECMKECTATVPCVAFTFIPGMEICALKAPKDAATMVPASGRTISGRLDGERPSVRGKELDSTICLSCLPGFSVNTWPFSIQSARDHLSTSRHQGHSILGSLESADLHPWDEGEGNAGYGGSALLLALLDPVDHQHFHVRGLSILILPLNTIFSSVDHAGS